MSRRRWPWLALLFVCSAGMVAAEDVTVTPRIGEPELKAARERFQALQSRKLDPKLLESIKKLLQDNPKAKPEELARKLLADRPDLLDPKNLDALRELTREARQPDTKLPRNPFREPQKNETQPAPEPPPQRSTAIPPDFGPGEDTPQATIPKSKGVIQPDAAGKRPPFDGPAPVVQNPQEPATAPPRLRPGSDGPTLRPLTTPTSPGQQISPIPMADGIQLPSPPPPGNPRDYQAAAQWWEKNFGPLKDSPAMQDLLTEFLKGQPGQSKSPFAKLLEGSKLPDVGKPGGLPKAFNLDGFKLDGLPQMPNSPTVPNGLDMPSFGGFSGDASGLGTWLLILAAVGVIGFIAYKLLNGRGFFGSEPRALAGLGPWPINPRTIRTRDDLVKAFEYLSVLTIGGPARHYHHGTIAAELDRLVPDAGELPQEVAHWYALARYAPAGSELTAEELAAARDALCRLAGVKP